MTAELAPLPGLIEATAPPERRGVARDGVRLLVTDRATRSHRHAHFFELASFLHAGDLLVVNDSATLPGALTAARADGTTLSLHIATKIDRRIWTVEPRGAVLSGEELHLPDGGSVVLIAPVEPERPRVWYGWFQLPLAMPAYLARHGLPIRYGYISQRFPIADYQTMFARNADTDGSAEMPSAARPFTPRVVRSLRRAGIDIVAVTLHCGVASFEQPERPGTERYAVSPETADAVNLARREGRRIIAVGSTALRALESATARGGLVAASGWTDVVIDERHRPRMADGLLTGFHDAAATHQSILRAFLGTSLLEAAYAEASERGYRCHEFGDAHLIVSGAAGRRRTSAKVTPMSELRVYTIDGGVVETVEDFYNEIERNIIPQRRWARDLTGFDDVLGGDYGTPDGGFILRITEADAMEARLGHRLFARILAIARKHGQGGKRASDGVILELT